MKTTDGKQRLYGVNTRHIFEFTEWTPALAYLYGAYITDGHVFRVWKTKKISGFRLSVTSPEFTDRVAACLEAIGQPVTRSVLEPRWKMTKPQYIVTSHSSLFARWLDETSQGKTTLPEIPAAHALPFLEAVIDGDGMVTKHGAIKVRSSDTWILRLPAILDSLGVRHSETVNKTPTGEPYYGVSIRRADFRALGPTLAVPYKQERMMTAQDTRTRADKNLTPVERVVCPGCGEKRMHPGSSLCFPCSRRSPEALARLREQASAAGKRGNAVRWGHH